jgi:hypothetical protein
MLRQIVDARIPARPVDGGAHFSLTDELWGLCRRCWVEDAVQRPSMREVMLALTDPRLREAAPTDADQFAYDGTRPGHFVGLFPGRPT